MLKSEEVELVSTTFHLDPAGNYQDEATGKRTGANILYRSSTDPLVDDATLFKACHQLLEHRSHRIRPLLDDKVLTDWNGLMIAALAKSGTVLEDPQLIHQAETCVQFIQRYLMPKPDRLLHRWREGEAKIDGFLDDYAYLIMGLMALYEATGKEEYCELALGLTNTVLRDFRSGNGDFFMVPREGEPLLLRPSQPFDNAMPSGNAVMMMNLLRLARITRNPELEEAGHQSIETCSGGLANYPTGFSAALSALDYALGSASEVIISGPPDQIEVKDTLSTLRKVYAPNAVILSRPEFQNTSAYAIHICQGNTCELSDENVGTVMHRISKSLNH